MAGLDWTSDYKLAHLLMHHTYRVWGMRFRQSRRRERLMFKRVASTGPTTTYTYRKFTVRATTLSMMTREKW